MTSYQSEADPRITEFHLLVSESIKFLRETLKDDARNATSEVQHLTHAPGQHQATIALKIIEIAQLNGDLK